MPSATSSTSGTSTTTHNAFLEQYIAAYKNTEEADSSQHVQAWEVTWINDTAARVQITVLNTTSNLTGSTDETFMVLPTTQDATNYVNAMNLTAYSLASTEYTGGIYQAVTGHAPQVYKEYSYTEGSALDLSQYQLHTITQADNFVATQTGKFLS
jgi:hypothetical protein